MADKVTNNRTVKMTVEYGDGSENTISQNNPTNTDLVNKIKAFSTFAVENKLFKSQKSEATISRIKEAKIVNRQETDFDLG